MENVLISWLFSGNLVILLVAVIEQLDGDEQLDAMVQLLVALDSKELKHDKWERSRCSATLAASFTLKNHLFGSNRA